MTEVTLRNADVAAHLIIETMDQALKFWTDQAKFFGTPGVNSQYEFCVKAYAINRQALEKLDFKVTKESWLKDRVSKQKLLLDAFEKFWTEIEAAVPKLASPATRTDKQPALIAS